MATWRRTWKTRWRKPNGPRPDNALPFQRLSRTGYTSSITDPPLASGMVLPMIGKLLGHSKIQTTARYAHLARASVKESAAWAAASIGADILARRLRDGCRRDSSTLRPDSDVRGKSARGDRPGPKRLRRFACAGSILSWSGRVASAGISLNRRIPPGISGWSILSRPGSQAAGRSRGVSGRESCHRRLVTG